MASASNMAFIPTSPCRTTLTKLNDRNLTKLEPSSPSSKGFSSSSIMMKSGKAKGGFFNRMKEAILRPVVEVEGSGSKGNNLIECVFCKGSGMNDCVACKGSGKDALGECLMCSGETFLECTVCSGVGTVDKIRRGGTDDKNEYTVKK